MKKTINGNKYTFFIDYFKFRNKVNFFIEARHKNTNRHSLINNVNCILSGLGIDAYNKKFWESEWIITKKQSEKFFKIAVDFLADQNCIPYIEKDLDLDRKLGEWNKI